MSYSQKTDVVVLSVGVVARMFTLWSDIADLLISRIDWQTVFASNDGQGASCSSITKYIEWKSTVLFSTYCIRLNLPVSAMSSSDDVVVVVDRATTDVRAKTLQNWNNNCNIFQIYFHRCFFSMFYPERNLVGEFIGTSLGATNNPVVIDHGPTATHENIERKAGQRELASCTHISLIRFNNIACKTITYPSLQRQEQGEEKLSWCQSDSATKWIALFQLHLSFY